MIKHAEIADKYNETELSDAEARILKDMEDTFSEHIERYYVNGESVIRVPFDLVHDEFSRLTAKRQMRVKEFLLRDMRDAGWHLDKIYGFDVYHIKPKMGK
jgi:hypothetical protein